MTKKKLIPLLITQYEKAIDEISKSNLDYYDCNGYMNILLKYSVRMGICHCAALEFNVNIINKKWVEKYKTSSLYWNKIPMMCSTKEETLLMLQYRLDILKRLQKESSLTSFIKNLFNIK